MTKLKYINIKVGIYDSQATITRHKSGRVTIRSPFVKWTDNTGTLAFENIKLAGNNAKIAGEIFSDSPPESDYCADYEMTYCEFLDKIA